MASSPRLTHPTVEVAVESAVLVYRKPEGPGRRGRQTPLTDEHREVLAHLRDAGGEVRPDELQVAGKLQVVGGEHVVH
jgi:uncharacterized membrane protein